MMLPAARSRWPLETADTVMAISGSVPATARRTTPPSASPRPKRRSRKSVVFESAVPATHVAIAPAPKTTTRSGVDRDPTPRSLTKLSAGLKMSGGRRSVAHNPQSKGRLNELGSARVARRQRRTDPAQARLRPGALSRDGRVLELRHLVHDHLDPRRLPDVVLHRLPVRRTGCDHVG